MKPQRLKHDMIKQPKASVNQHLHCIIMSPQRLMLMSIVFHISVFFLLQHRGLPVPRQHSVSVLKNIKIYPDWKGHFTGHQPQQCWPFIVTTAQCPPVGQRPILFAVLRKKVIGKK